MGLKKHGAIAPCFLYTLQKFRKDIKYTQMVNQKKGQKLIHSQNFIKDSGLVEKLINMADLNKRDLVVEIGPGKGIITKILAKKVKRVIAIELDNHLANDLSNKLKIASTNIKVIKDDFLNWQLPKEPFKVFSNIPFNQTADIIKKLVKSSELIEAYLIVQDKAAQRFTGHPKETQMSILLKSRFDISILAKINKTQFVPQPNVNAVLLKIQKQEKPLITSNKTQPFKDFVIYGFNQWKPSVLEAFNLVFSNTQKSLIRSKLKIDTQKPSKLNLEQWLQLFEVFTNYVSPEKQIFVYGAEERLIKQQSKLTKLHRTRN